MNIVQSKWKEEIEIKENSQDLTISDSDTKIELKQKDLITTSVQKEIQKQVDSDKNFLYTLFGLFASVVTFISVEVQILKSACGSFTLAWLSLIMLWWLWMFIVLIDYIGKWWRNRENNPFPKNLAYRILFLFVIWILLSCLWNEQQCKENEIYQKFEHEYWKKLIELENKIDHNKMFSEMYF